MPDKPGKLTLRRLVSSYQDNVNARAAQLLMTNPEHRRSNHQDNQEKNRPRINLAVAFARFLGVLIASPLFGFMGDCLKT